MVQSEEMKSMLRKHMLALRKTISSKERSRASITITQSVKILPQWKKAKIVNMYKALPTEVDTSYLKEDRTKIFVTPESKQKADLYIVPGVAFDKEGHRLGRGQGFYDRLLTRVKAPKIGLAFTKQMVAQVPNTKYDVSMTMVVTQDETYTP